MRQDSEPGVRAPWQPQRLSMAASEALLSFRRHFKVQNACRRALPLPRSRPELHTHAMWFGNTWIESWPPPPGTLCPKKYCKNTCKTRNNDHPELLWCEVDGGPFCGECCPLSKDHRCKAHTNSRTNKRSRGQETATIRRQTYLSWSALDRLLYILEDQLDAWDWRNRGLYSIGQKKKHLAKCILAQLTDDQCPDPEMITSIPLYVWKNHVSEVSLAVGDERFSGTGLNLRHER